ncbi:alpha/beta fold hydrolase [Ramlibacter sp. H39-3-26]|uniref:alpha/beta hydrolase n=1 Tax=Curvibacter soli TaxID=3031331 RepID=UPI0023DC32B0|nr:alpha/beta fold hydrolase [Ramlibacter sp. H39-3-26]MDF1486472.1 alpha/beta fold hydrolase [Ramlibacter sp. H39-3-26]
MSTQTQPLPLTGAAGAIEAVRDPALVEDGATPRGVAVIAHPHPLFGGTMDNKVVQTLARAFVQCGWTAVRFNFRGVGGSAGAYDEGRGETEDFLAVVRQAAPEGLLAIAGFSFGSFVASRALETLWNTRDIAKLVFVGTAAARFRVADIPPEAHERMLVVHGEQDDTVPLSDVMDWARPQTLPVTVIPGGGHFFHGQLPLLKSLVVRHLRS